MFDFRYRIIYIGIGLHWAWKKIQTSRCIGTFQRFNFSCYPKMETVMIFFPVLSFIVKWIFVIKTFHRLAISKSHVEICVNGIFNLSFFAHDENEKYELCAFQWIYVHCRWFKSPKGSENHIKLMQDRSRIFKNLWFHVFRPLIKIDIWNFASGPQYRMENLMRKKGAVAFMLFFVLSRTHIQTRR